MKKLCLALCFGCCIFQSAIAKHVLPVFSGLWCASIECQSQKGYFVNNCGYGHVSPECHFCMQSEKKLAETLIGGSLPEYCSITKVPCKWTDMQVFPYEDIVPDEFPGLGRDWVLVKQESLIPKLYRRECLDSWEEQCDSVNAFIYPFFQCPNGSRFTTADKDDGVLVVSGTTDYGACATKPTFGCLGDVVGRDKGSSGGFLGHVGIVSSIPNTYDACASTSVVEVLDAAPVIQENTAVSFRSATSYWGARYGAQGVSETQDMDWKVAQNIIINAKNLTEPCKNEDVKYDWHRNKQHLCQFDPDYGKDVAILRCDFFVNEAYKATEKVGEIIDFGANTTPAWLFNNLLFSRFDADPSRNYPSAKTDFTADLGHLQRKLDHASWYLTERYVEKAFAVPSFDLYDIYLAMDAFQKNNLEPDIEKARFLWDLALKHQDDKDKFKYLIEDVVDLKPVELADEIISEYYRQTNLDNKLNLLWHIIPLRMISTYTTEKIKKLYDDIVFHETNLDLVSHAVTMYPLLSDAEELALFDQVFQRSDIGEDLKKKMYMTEGFYSGQVRRVLSSLDLQRKYLKDFIDQVEKYGNKRFLITALCTVFMIYEPSNIQGSLIGFDPAKLDDSVRPILLDYLKANVPDPFGHEFGSLGNDRVYYQWLRTYIAVQSKTLDESLKKTADYIKGLDNLPLKALLLENADDTLYKTQFSTEELESLLKTFKEKVRPRFFQLKNGKSVFDENYGRPSREMLIFGDVVRSLERRIKERNSNH